MEIDKIKTEKDLLEFEESHSKLSLHKNETVRELAHNIMEEYFCIKEEPLQHVDPELILSNIDTGMVYTTRIDDMPFLMQSNNLENLNYNKCLEKIERDSKPKYKPGTPVTRKRKISFNNYNAMSKRLKLLFESRQKILDQNTKLLTLCNIVNVVVEKILNVEPKIPIIAKDEVYENEEVKTEIEEKQSSENITEVADSDDDKPLSEIISLDETTCQNTIIKTQNIITRPIERPISKGIGKHTTACTIYFYDTYFNNSVVCGVDEKGIIRVYIQHHGKINFKRQDLRAIHNSSIMHTFTRCCWYSFNEKIKKIWYNGFNVLKYEKNSSDIICKPHRCRLDTCDCCCRNKLEAPINNSLNLPNCENQSALTSEIVNLRPLVTEIRKYLSEPVHTNELYTNTSGIINAQTPFIHLKNIETCQSELYYLNKNGNIGGYYINWYKCKTPSISKLINFALSSSYNTMYLIVCCWANREAAIAGLLKSKLNCTHPAILRYMKRFHACEPQNCKCCCKDKLKQDIKKPKFTLKPLILPIIRNHTVQNRPIYSVNRKIDLPPSTAKVAQQIPQNQSVDKHVAKKIPTTGITKVKTYEHIAPLVPNPPRVPIPPSLNAVNNSTNNSLLHKHSPEEKQPSPTVVETSFVGSKPKSVTTLQDTQSNKAIINGVYNLIVLQPLPNTMSNTILTVDDNRKVAAALPSPVTEYSKEELHCLAVVLIKAQEQVNALMLPPGTKLNIIKPVPGLNVNCSTLTPTQPSSDGKSVQQKNMYKQFTYTAVLKSQSYKNCFYHGKNLQALQIKESDPTINVKSVSTMNEHKAELEKVDYEIVAGPSGIQVPIAIPSTSRGPTDVYHNEMVHSSEDMALLTVINTGAAESSDDHSDDEYDIHFSDIDADIKPILNDDITIEDNEIQDTDSESENDECILGT